MIPSSPPVLNIVLIDIATMHMADQMYLHNELKKFLNEERAGQPLAVYLRGGSGCFLVQNFTSDRKLLLDAVDQTIPRFPPPNPTYLSDMDTMRQIVISLRQVPGRKNVLWFSGGSTLFLIPNVIPTRNDAELRALYDELNLQRIAIYPIDARGLEVIFGPDRPADNRKQTHDDSQSNQKWAQHVEMNHTAEATGGEAFYNSNGLKEIAQHVLETFGSFYTLTYSPHSLHLDNKWHKIRVVVRGTAYHLSYRRGYFADGSLRGTGKKDGTGTTLLASGEKLDVIEPGSRNPIIFKASVLRAPELSAKTGMLSTALRPAQNGSVPFSIRLTVPLDALTVRQVDGKHQVVIGFAAFALDRYGRPVERKAKELTIFLNEQVYRVAPNLPITLDQELELAADAKFLDIGVWDPSNRRFGTIQIPLEILKSPKHEAAAGNN